MPYVNYYLVLLATSSLACPSHVASKLDPRYHDQGRYPRAVAGDDQGSSLYFDGSDSRLKLVDTNAVAPKGSDAQRSRFSVDLWIKAEGGQNNPAVILELADVCSDGRAPYTWRLGIATGIEEKEKDARFFFALKTDTVKDATVLRDHKPYTSQQWVHLTAVYSGRDTSFYVNGARIGQLFSQLKGSCKQLVMGRSNSLRGNTAFRGNIASLRLWRIALTHEQVRNLFTKADSKSEDHYSKDELIFEDHFQNLENWLPLSDSTPSIVGSHSGFLTHEFQATVPPCGQTVCDDPRIIINYAKNVELRQHKTVVNILDGDGSKPSVSREQIMLQHETLNRVFNRYNISWRLEIVDLMSRALRRKTIVFGCETVKVGDKQCHSECRLPITADDGGDCEDLGQCSVDMLGNGRCDQACNRVDRKWDNGECCNASNVDVNTTCIDPESHLRAYIGVNEFKEVLNFSNDNSLTVTFAEWSNNELIGLATFPWEKDMYTIYGGVVMQANKFGVDGHRDNLVHELGHVLGLWHVHHGVSEMSCDDPCREVEASLLHGDLCSDTRPTPKNVQCHDPYNQRKKGGKSVLTPCEDSTSFTETPYTNYMSYAGDDCTNHFTDQQAARMHCYLDLKYKRWTVDAAHTVSTSPLPPKVKSVDRRSENSSVTITWLPPLEQSSCAPTGVSPHLGECTKDGTLLQYASKAWSKGFNKKAGYWSSHQATGAPDAEPCEASTKAWLPDSTICDEPAKCGLTVEFEIAVIAETLSVWVSWNAADGIKNILIHFVDGSVEFIDAPPTFCDMPLTVSLFEKMKKVKKVEIHTSNPFVSIDAVRLTSTPHQHVCHKCHDLSYNIIRLPPLGSAKFVETRSTSFTDVDLDPTVTYSYQVRVIDGAIPSSLSSPLIFSLMTSPVCGDGQIQRAEEECDDGNGFDGDGCSASCLLENHFHCSYEPSLCYIYINDGVCEEFERTESFNDCGFHTPVGFHDQWVHSTSSSFASASIDPNCRASALVGPSRYTECSSSLSEGVKSWKPCFPSDNSRNHWILVTFQRAVVATSVLIHLSSVYPDGDDFLILELLLADNKTSVIQNSENVHLSCKRNIIEYPILHDLSKPFRLIRGVYIYPSTDHLTISAVRLRSKQFADSAILDQCISRQLLYDPVSNTCISDTCFNKSSICPNLTVDNASINCTKSEVCSVTCHHGFRFGTLGSAMATSEPAAKVYCIKGRWSDINRECIPIDCGQPHVTNAVFTCPMGTTVGHNCTFHCLTPARMKGVNNMITCSSEGRWSVPEAYCRSSCSAPLDAEFYSKNQGNACHMSMDAVDNRYQVGVRCRFMCPSGYHVEGQSIRKRTVRRVCGEGGVWKGARCIKVKCPPPKLVYFGVYNCTHEFDVGTECSFRCPGTKDVRMSICKPDASWTLTEPCSVVPKTKCLPPMPPQGISIECPRKSFIGSVCKLSCNAYGYEPVVEHAVTTERNFRMRVLVKVAEITCSVRKMWEPEVQSVVCVKKCTNKFVGDGWCDFQNNRGYCAWDGGDCCPSTAKGGRVKLMFPSLCTSHLCRCLDPYAIENRNDLERAKFSDDQQAHIEQALNKSTLEMLIDNSKHLHSTSRNVRASLNRTLQKMYKNLLVRT